VYGPFLGCLWCFAACGALLLVVLCCLWCFARLWVQAPSGRQRLNVLAALHATTLQLITVTNLTYINAATVCELLHRLAQEAARLQVPVTVVLDNAPYQRCAVVQACAQSLRIELLYLPPYSPQLNLIERFWRFVKKQCLYATYYANFAAFQKAIFQKAIVECIEQSPHKHQKALKSLLTLRFQTLPKASFVTV
jgi:transposase